jgi:pantothenate kinase
MKAMEANTGKPSPAALTAGDVPVSEAEPDVFPCILATCGSGFIFFKISSDGTFKAVDASSRGGKAFLIGSLLTGCQTFSELLELAENGTQRGVDDFSDELFDTSDAVDDDDSVYAKAKKAAPSLIFSFGKTFGKKLADLKREDLARGWLQYVVLDLVQCVQHACLLTDTNRLFFCGGFCDHPLVRRLITTELVRRNLLRVMFAQPGVIQFDFIKPGTHLGALGCVVKDVSTLI